MVELVSLAFWRMCRLEAFSLDSRSCASPNKYSRLCRMFFLSIVDPQLQTCSDISFQMLRSLDKTVTRVAQNNLDKFTPPPPEEPKTPSSQFSSSRLLPAQSPKLWALLIRNAIRNVLRKHFRKMLSRMFMRRACWRLVKSLKKREMEKAFLLIRSYTNQKALEAMHSFYQKMPELKILTSLCCRILAKPERRALSRIRAHSLRRKRVHHFVARLEECLSVGTFRETARLFWSHLMIERSKLGQKELACQETVRWVRSRIDQRRRNCISDLFDSVLGSTCNSDLEEWRTKKEKIAQKAEDRKQALAKVREDLKTAKGDYDEQKGTRNKVYQEHKKVAHATKTEMGELVKSYEKERKAEEAEHKAIRAELEDLERMWAARETIVEKNRDAKERCFRYYRRIAGEEPEFKGLERIIPSLSADLREFRECPNYLFLKNQEMGKLIDLYEKRQPYNYEAKYYDLEYQNRVVRETMRCFVREKFEAAVSLHKWKHHHLSSPALEDEQEDGSDL